jgi:hypothetical protein
MAEHQQYGPVPHDPDADAATQDEATREDRP